MNARDDWRETGEPTEVELSLERELSEMEPWSPSARLRHCLEAEAARWEAERGDLEPAPPALGTRRWFPPIPLAQALAGMAAAAALVAFLLAPSWVGRLDAPETASTESGPRVQPAEAPAAAGSESLIRWDGAPSGEDWELGLREQFLLGSEYEGMVEPEQGPPMWRVRYRLLNRTSWQDQQTGAAREQFVPEERVLFVPVRHH